MERTKPVLGNVVAIAAALTSVGLFFGFQWLGRELGASPWLTGLVTLTVVMLVLGGSNYRKVDEMRQKALLLLFVSLIGLTIASVVNEYVLHFFSPSRGYALLAFLPAISFVAYRAWMERRVPNAEIGESGGYDPSIAMYRVLLCARTGSVAFLFIFVLAEFVAALNAVRPALILAILICVFVDATVSYKHPQHAKQTPSNFWLANISRTSFFHDPKATQAYTLAVALLSGILCAVFFAKLLGYW